MTIKTTSKITIFLAIFLIFSFILPQMVFSIGQMTKPILIENVLRGQEITETLKLFNSEDKEVVYGLKAEGDIENWASFYGIEDKNLENPVTQIKIPPASYLDAIVKFTIPEDTPNGQYSGEIAVTSAPKKDSETENMVASVFQKIGREVLITVTDNEIIRLDAVFIPLKYGVKEGDSLKIKVIYDNQGNVSLRPDIQLTIIKSNKTVFNAIFPYPEAEEAIKPKTTKTMPLIEWQTAGQENGQYRAEIKVLLDNEVVEEHDFKFTIGFTSGTGFLAFITKLGASGWFIIGAFFAALAGILAFFQKNSKLKNSKRKNNKKINA